MHKKLFLFCLLCLALSVFLWSGCNGRKAKPDSALIDQGTEVGRIDDVEAIEKLQKIPEVGPYDTVVVDKVAMSRELQEEYPEIMNEFKTGLLGRLLEVKAFANVVEVGGQASDKGIRIEGEVLDLRIVSGAARVIGGTLAGSSYMDVFVKLTDIETGRVLDQKVISSNSNPFGAYWSGGESDRSLPSDMGRIIGEYVYKVAPTEL